MKFVEVRRNISASPTQVWKILTDANRLVAEDLGIIKLEGTIALGSKLKLWTEVSPDRAFSLKVTEFELGKHMIWEGGMPLGLFTGRRQFNLTPNGNSTELHIHEEFTGPLSGLIWKSIPNLKPSFDKFADGIKSIVERKVE